MLGIKPNEKMVSTLVIVFLLFLINSPLMYNLVQDKVVDPVLPQVSLVNQDGPTVVGMLVHAMVFTLVVKSVVGLSKKVVKTL